MNELNYERVTQALDYLEKNQFHQPGLSDLSKHLSLSETHTRRLFQELVGINPGDYLKMLNLVRSREFLKSRFSLLSASEELGLSSASRLYDLFLKIEAMTPGEYKNGGENLKIRYDSFESPLGSAYLASTEKGICRLSFSVQDSKFLKELKNEFPKAEIVPGSLADQIGKVQKVFSGQSPEKHGQTGGLNLHLKGSPFQLKVWEALIKIPKGQVDTYGHLADVVGNAKACRAVGSAVGANPVAVLIPCHRVILKSGVVGNYHWGPARKKALLCLEGARQFSNLS